jgi:Mobilization protein NikA
MATPSERRKPDAERKTEMIPVRCTQAHKRVLGRKAKARGIGVSTWLLQLGLSAPDKPSGGV